MYGMWRLICTSWGKKKKLGSYRERRIQLMKGETSFLPSLGLAWRHLWSDFVALPLSDHSSVLTLECASYSVYCCGWYFRSCFQKNRCISELFKMYLVMTSRIFVSKTNKKDNFSIWDICLLILQKHFWECRLSLRDTRGLREPGFHCPLSCSPPILIRMDITRSFDLVSSRFTHPWVIQHLTQVT